MASRYREIVELTRHQTIWRHPLAKPNRIARTIRKFALERGVPRNDGERFHRVAADWNETGKALHEGAYTKGPYSEWEDTVIRGMAAAEIPDEVIAACLARPPKGVETRRHRLGVVYSKRTEWEASELTKLQECLSQGLSIGETAKRLGRSRDSVKCKMQRQGL